MSVLTLYEIENDLAAFLDTADGGVDEALEQQFLDQFQATLAQAVEKRDRVAQFLAYCEQQAAFADAEIKRLQALKKSYQRAKERLEEYVVHVIRSIGPDETGRYRPLAGRTATLSIRACPPSVEIRNEEFVPSQYKMLTVTVPLAQWERAIGRMDADDATELLRSVTRMEISIDKRAIKAAIDAGETVPGADLAIGKYTLIRK